MTTHNTNTTIGSNQLANKIKMTKIECVIEQSERNDSNSWKKLFYSIANKNKIIEKYVLNHFGRFNDCELNYVLDNSEPLIIFIIDRSTPNWEVKEVVCLEGKDYKISKDLDITYNLTVTNDSVNLVYTNLSRMTKNIEQNSVNFTLFKKQNYRYQTKEELEEIFDTDGFIVLKNALCFMKSDKNKVYVNKLLPNYIQNHYVYILYKSLKVSKARCNTILVDANLEQERPELFV